MELIEPLRDGIAMLFCVMIGDESGDDSATVEWCKFVHAREKSRPLECLGIDVAGEPYEVKGSSCGDKGARFAGGLDIVMSADLDGKCNDNPRERKSALLGVRGLIAGIALSSLVVRDLSGLSLICGDGSRPVALSDRDRIFVPVVSKETVRV